MSVAAGILILVTFVVGISVNGVFLWILGVKMTRTVNTLWFIHLTLIHLMSCFVLPLFAVYVIFDFDWKFGLLVCKLANFFFSVGMYTTVFLLTIISLDRYLFTCHSVWSQHYRTLSWASKLIVGLWAVSLILSVPNFVFRDIKEMDKRNKCDHNFSAIEKENANHVHMVFYFIQLLVAFLLPFLVIVICYCCIVHEMKKKGFLRSGKTLKVLTSAVASFFICWLPYHVYHTLMLFNITGDTISSLWCLMAAGICLNICFTPIIYLFVGEKFQQVFKVSIVAQIRRIVVDGPISPEGNSNMEDNETRGETTEE